MKCPVCDKENQTMVCPQCGFDGSMDYEKYPTLGPVGKAPSVSALRREWAQKHPEPVEKPVIPPPPEPPKKKKPWLTIAACAAMLALGIAIGIGLAGGKSELPEPKETVQLQKPLETTIPPKTTMPPETTDPQKPWETNILRSDTIVDADGNGYYSDHERVS